MVDYTVTSPDNSVEETDAAIASSDQNGGFSATQTMYQNSTNTTETTTVTETTTKEGTARGESLCGAGLSSVDCAVVVLTGGGMVVMVLVAALVCWAKSMGRHHEEKKGTRAERAAMKDNDPLSSPKRNPVVDAWGPQEAPAERRASRGPIGSSNNTCADGAFGDATQNDPHEAPLDESTTKFGRDTNNDAPLDPSSFPLPPEEGDWAFDDASGMYWSEQEFLYVDTVTNQYFDPNSDMWWDPEADRWYKE